MKNKLTILGMAVAFLCGCKTNSIGWPIIWFMNNGSSVQKPKSDVGPDTYFEGPDWAPHDQKTIGDGKPY